MHVQGCKMRVQGCKMHLNLHCFFYTKKQQTKKTKHELKRLNSVCNAFETPLKGMWKTFGMLRNALQTPLDTF